MRLTFCRAKVDSLGPADGGEAARLVGSEAILARNLLCDSPTDTVTPISVSTVLAKRASTTAGGARCSAAVPPRSRKASSIDRGCTSGVSRSISARICRLTPTYFCMFGGSTTACGQSLRAVNIGIAERTPNCRAR